MDRARLTPDEIATHRQRAKDRPKVSEKPRPSVVVRSFIVQMEARASSEVLAGVAAETPVTAQQDEVKFVRVATPAATVSHAVHEEASTIDPASARLAFLVRGLSGAQDITKAWLSASDGQHVADLTVRQIASGIRLDGIVEPGVAVRVDLELNGVAEGVKVEVLLLGGGKVLP